MGMYFASTCRFIDYGQVIVTIYVKKVKKTIANPISSAMTNVKNWLSDTSVALANYFGGQLAYTA